MIFYFFSFLQVIGFGSVKIVAFIAMVGILSIVAQVSVFYNMWIKKAKLPTPHPPPPAANPDNLSSIRSQGYKFQRVPPHCCLSCLTPAVTYLAHVENH